MVEEEEMAEASPVETAPEAAKETFEQKRERELREDYLRRAKASHAEREAIFRDNGLLKEGESLAVDTEAMNRRCC